MKFATISTMLMAAATHAVFCGSVLADGRGHGSFGVSRGGNMQGSAMQSHAPQMMNGGGGNGMKLPSGAMKTYTPSQQNLVGRNITKFQGQLNGVTKSNPQIFAPRSPSLPGLGGKPVLKPIDLGLGKGKGPIIDSGFGQGKKPIDLGIGNGKPPQIDPGIGNGKKPIDLGIGNGTIPLNPNLVDKLKGAVKPGEKIPLNPDLVDKLKGAVQPGNKLPLNPDLVGKLKGAIVKPKIPICPPHPFPHHPPHWCHPCPPIFLGWCWFPGFNNCYGYVGGLALPPIVSGPMVVELPPSDVLVTGALPQIVPGTTVVATVTGAGDTMGQVMMQYNSVAMPAQVQKWEGDKVTFVVPAVALQQPVEVKLVFLRATGDLVQEVNAELVAATVEQQP